MREIRYNQDGDKMQYRRKMGIDYGDKRIGIAMTDLLCMIASAYEVYQNEDMDKAVEYISKLALSSSVDEIIVGLPLNMEGEENERTEITRVFGEKLAKKSGVPVAFEDERLSYVEAEDILREFESDWKKRKKLLDMYSAQVILQSYLDSNKRK